MVSKQLAISKSVTEQLCLTQGSLEAHISSSMKELLSEKKLPDVTLVSDDVTLVSDDLKQIQAHRIVLAASSPVLKNLLLSNHHTQQVLVVAGVGQQELKAFIDFLYLGEVHIDSDRLSYFTELCKNLKMKDFDLTFQTKGEPESFTYLAW